MPSEAFKLNETTIGEMITEDDDVSYNSFVIPPYQRRYDWKKEQWNMLLLDIEKYIESEDARDIFLGTIITLADDSKTDKVETIHDVIDGQQRLTTILIIYIVVCEYLQKIDSNTLSENKLKRYVKIVGSLKSISKPTRLRHENDLLLPGVTETMYQRLYHTVFSMPITAAVDKRSRYYLAYKFYLDAIKKKTDKCKNDEEKFDVLFKIIFVIKRARIIWASVKELSFAIQMFDVLNSRGLPLSVTDIIRTTYLSGMMDAIDTTQAGVQRNDIVNHVELLWRSLRQHVTVSSSSTVGDDKNDALFRRFLRHMYMLDKGSAIVESRMPEVYKSWIKESFATAYNDKTQRPQLKNPMQDILERNSILYGFILNPRNPLAMQNVFIYPQTLVEKSKQLSSNPERVVTEMMFDIANLGLIQINLLLLIIFKTFAAGEFSETEYNSRFSVLKLIISGLWKFVIRRNLTDEPRPNDMDSISIGLIAKLKKMENEKGVVDRLKYILLEIENVIKLSGESLQSAVMDIKYEQGQNQNLRYLLHILEKWEKANTNYVLRNISSPFNGFELVLIPGTTPKLKWTIEHVLPQSILRINDQIIEDEDEDDVSSPASSSVHPWSSDLQKWNSNLLTISSNNRAEIIHSMGNLTLVDHNSNLSDRVLKQKQTAMKDGNPIGFNAAWPRILNQEDLLIGDIRQPSLSTISRWTELEIENRKSALVEMIMALLI
jgi:hypothetical protein